jgi:hypothetical protein
MEVDGIEREKELSHGDQRIEKMEEAIDWWKRKGKQASTNTRGISRWRAACITSGEMN